MADRREPPVRTERSGLPTTEAIDEMIATGPGTLDSSDEDIGRGRSRSRQGRGRSRPSQDRNPMAPHVPSPHSRAFDALSPSPEKVGRGRSDADFTGLRRIASPLRRRRSSDARGSGSGAVAEAPRPSEVPPASGRPSEGGTADVDVSALMPGAASPSTSDSEVEHSRVPQWFNNLVGSRPAPTMRPEAPRPLSHERRPPQPRAPGPSSQAFAPTASFVPSSSMYSDGSSRAFAWPDVPVPLNPDWLNSRYPGPTGAGRLPPRARIEPEDAAVRRSRSPIARAGWPAETHEDSAPDAGDFTGTAARAATVPGIAATPAPRLPGSGEEFHTGEDGTLAAGSRVPPGAPERPRDSHELHAGGGSSAAGCGGGGGVGSGGGAAPPPPSSWGGPLHGEPADRHTAERRASSHELRTEGPATASTGSMPPRNPAVAPPPANRYDYHGMAPGGMGFPGGMHPAYANPRPWGYPDGAPEYRSDGITGGPMPPVSVPYRGVTSGPAPLPVYGPAGGMMPYPGVAAGMPFGMRGPGQVGGPMPGMGFMGAALPAAGPFAGIGYGGAPAPVGPAPGHMHHGAGPAPFVPHLRPPPAAALFTAGIPVFPPAAMPPAGVPLAPAMPPIAVAPPVAAVPPVAPAPPVAAVPPVAGVPPAGLPPVVAPPAAVPPAAAGAAGTAVAPVVAAVPAGAAPPAGPAAVPVAAALVPPVVVAPAPPVLLMTAGRMLPPAEARAAIAAALAAPVAPIAPIAPAVLVAMAPAAPPGVPALPVDPVAPVAPLAHVAPVEPVAPEAAVAPAAAVAAVAPVAPVALAAAVDAGSHVELPAPSTPRSSGAPRSPGHDDAFTAGEYVPEGTGLESTPPGPSAPDVHDMGVGTTPDKLTLVARGQKRRIPGDRERLRATREGQFQLVEVNVDRFSSRPASWARPRRHVIPPLLHWRNEQIIYERVPGSAMPTVKGVVLAKAKGTLELTPEKVQIPLPPSPDTTVSGMGQSSPSAFSSPGPIRTEEEDEEDKSSGNEDSSPEEGDDLEDIAAEPAPKRRALHGRARGRPGRGAADDLGVLPLRSGRSPALAKKRDDTVVLTAKGREVSRRRRGLLQEELAEGYIRVEPFPRGSAYPCEIRIGEDTGSLMCGDICVPPKSFNAPEVLARGKTLMIYVMSADFGKLSVDVGDHVITLGTGDHLVVRPENIYSLRNESEGMYARMKMVLVSEASTFEQ